jgi:hypothetical protein
MSRLASFFNGSETQFGIFYPKGYLVAVFRDYPTAVNAEKQVRHSGVPEDQVIAVPGQDVVDWTEENLVKKGLWATLMRELSRLFATEEIYNRNDLEHAKRGAAFLAVHCPTDARKQSAWNLIKGVSTPIAARHYSLGGVDHLLGENLP